MSKSSVVLEFESIASRLLLRRVLLRRVTSGSAAMLLLFSLLPLVLRPHRPTQHLSKGGSASAEDHVKCRPAAGARVASLLAIVE